MQKQGPQDPAWNSLQLWQKGGRRLQVSIPNLPRVLGVREGGAELEAMRCYSPTSLLPQERERRRGRDGGPEKLHPGPHFGPQR